jgi:hypothetical protein
VAQAAGWIDERKLAFSSGWRLTDNSSVSRSSAIGVLAHLPLAVVIVLLGLGGLPHAGKPRHLGVPLAVWFIGTGIAGLITTVLLFAFGRHVYSNPRLSHAWRICWIVLLFVGNYVAIPVYWWLYIRRPPKGAPLSAVGSG